MAIDVNEIRKEIAIRHDILVGENDPLIALATMIEKLLEQCVTELNEQQTANLKTLINEMQKNAEEIRASAGRVVAQGTEYACDQLHNAIKATMDDGREELRKDIRLAWNKIEEARKASIVWAALSGLFALIAVVANYVS